MSDDLLEGEELEGDQIDELNPDKDFEDSFSRIWDGKDLEPYSPLRQSTAKRMGLRYGNLTADEIEEVEVEIPGTGKGKKKPEKVRMSTYIALHNDIVIYGWLCSVPDSRVLRAQRKIDEAVAEAWKWAQKTKLNEGSLKYLELVGIFMGEMHALHNSQGEPVTKKDGEEPEAQEGGLSPGES